MVRIAGHHSGEPNTSVAHLWGFKLFLKNTMGFVFFFLFHEVERVFLSSNWTLKVIVEEIKKDKK